MSDEVEVNTLNSNATNADSDGDGVSDGDEDLDGDGLSDGDEVNTHNTDPTNSDTDVSCLVHELSAFFPFRELLTHTYHFTSLRATV